MGRLLVTGGLGYVGGRVTSYVAEEFGSHSVRVMTHRSRRPEWAAGLDIVQGDVGDASTLAEAMRGVDGVIHLAAVDENISARDPELALRVNGWGTRVTVREAARSGVRRFCYVSTFHVYGPDARSPVTEETPTRPVHPYAISHHVAEDFVWEASRDLGIEVIVLRLSNAFGYPMDADARRPTLLFNDLCMQAVSSASLILRTPGSEQRDFVALRDVARALVHFMSLPTHQLSDGLFNVGRGQSMSIRRAADLVAQRYYVRSGRLPSIQAPDPRPGLSKTDLRFEVSKLVSTGFSFDADLNAEIDGTLDLAERIVGSPAARGA